MKSKREFDLVQLVKGQPLVNQHHRYALINILLE